MDKQIVLQGGTPGRKIQNAKDTYFIATYSPDGKMKAIKIGVCARGTAKTRLSVLQVGSLLQLKLLAIYGGNCERKFHRMFAKDWIRGEFFRPTRDLLLLIDKLRSISKDLAKLELCNEPQDIPQGVVAAQAA
jgi:hypothetical protein